MGTNKLTLIRLALMGLLLAACQNQATPVAPQTIPQAGTVPTALPTRAVTTSTRRAIAVDGVLDLATPMIAASFESSGKVTAMSVKPGQSVKKGDVLAELDGVTLNSALETAQESLALQQAQIEKSLAPATQTDIEVAQASLNAAYAAYNEVKNGPAQSDIDAALTSWNQARNSLYSSQLSRDRDCLRPSGTAWDEEAEKIAKTDPECKRADLAVESAEMSVATAHQKYLDAQKPATQNELTKAWASVVQAKASLATLVNGSSDAQKQIYEMQLQQAKLAVERAQRALAQTRLTSPCDCVVQSVNLAVNAASDGGIITLLDPAQVRFHTTNLSEQDVIHVKTGQAVTVRLKAFDQTFNGTVTAILPLSSGTQGTAALFTAIIHVDAAGATLLPGMTGQAEISLE